MSLLQSLKTPKNKDTFNPKLVDKTYLDFIENTYSSRWNEHMDKNKEYTQSMANVQPIILVEKEFKSNPQAYYFALETMVENSNTEEIIFNVKSEGGLPMYSSYYSTKSQAIEYLTMRRDMIEFDSNPYQFMLNFNNKKCSECSIPGVNFCSCGKSTPNPQNLRFDN